MILTTIIGLGIGGLILASGITWFRSNSYRKVEYTLDDYYASNIRSIVQTDSELLYYKVNGDQVHFYYTNRNQVVIRIDSFGRLIRVTKPFVKFTNCSGQYYEL